MMNLNEKYNRDQFISFLKEVFLKDFKSDIRPISTSNYKSFDKAHSLGRSESLDLHVFEFEYSGSFNKRIALAKDAFQVMKQSATFQALAVFHSPGGDDWRLSLMTANPQRTEKGKVTLAYSNPRRYSFFLGANAKVNTPTKFLLTKGTIQNFDDLKGRFSLEVVNKEFYREIAKNFLKLVGGKMNPEDNGESFKPMLKLPSTTAKGKTVSEFAVRLIGRIIFCWFLKEKQSEAGISLMPKELLSLEAVKKYPDYYHTVLEPIFFEVLNQHPRSRKDPFYSNSYSLIPYLNGGLFSPHDDDFYKRTNGDLQSQFHNTLSIPDKWFVDFFETLETYNFTIDENTSFDEELSIDPEMLGRIFENLLAEINPETGESARKSTGSYYTPRVIVDYMVDESLLSYLKQHTSVKEGKLRAIISYDLTDDADQPLTDLEKQELINVIGKIKILDPACGSGAFPIGSLQKMVFVLQQIDPEGQLWFKKQLKSTSPEIRRVIEREFSHKNFDYIRKLGVIRENIYGIDIQPIATEISRLRCFLTLVVDERIDDSAENRGIEPLPNLDFKFVAANSLLGLPTTNKQVQVGLFEDNEGISALKEIRDMFFNASGSDRDLLKLQFVQAQNKMFQRLISEGRRGHADLTTKLTSWDPFNNKVSQWFDPEWMFGIKEGFDIVIANPPYVDSESMTKNYPEMRQKYKELFETTKGNWDLFVPFIEKGLDLLNKTGVLSFITPNKLIAAKYGMKIREYISRKTICEIRDYSRLSVFIEADVYPVTIVVKNSQSESSVLSAFTQMRGLEEIEGSNLVDCSSIRQHPYWDIFFYHEEVFNLLQKLLKMSRLGGHSFNILGAATVNEAYEVKKVLFDSTEESEIKKIVNTGTIDKYQSQWGFQDMQYLKSKYSHPVIKTSDLKSINRIRLEQANSNKIIIAGMSKTPEAFYDKGEYLAGKSTSIVLGQKQNLLTLLGFLNSKLIDFFVNKYFNSLKMSGGYLNMSKEILENIPIPVDFNADLSQLVEKANGSPDEEKLSQIDSLVYKLYGLSEKEIEIVDKSL